MMGEDKTPLSRWSERKTKAREEASEQAPPAAEINAVVEANAPDQPEEIAPKTVAVEDLPDIDSLDADSDYTGFMAEGVPEQLKNMALRKLWRSDPLLANVDGLVDYGEDFSVAEIVGDAVKTAYKVGKGFVDKVEEIEDEEDEEEGGETEVAEDTGDKDDGSTEPG